MSYLNEFFDGTYLINLPGDTEKLAVVDKTLSNYGIEYQRINAIYGKDYAKQMNDPKFDKLNADKFKAIGCRESHVLAYRDAVSKGHETVLHIEDDLCFHNDMKTIKDYIDELPKDWEFVWFGYYLKEKAKVPNHSKQITEHWFTATNWWSTHMFAYNLKSPKVKMIWEKMASKYTYNHIDLWLCKEIEKQKANVYIPHPNLALQTIGPGTANKLERRDLLKSNSIIEFLD